MVRFLVRNPIRDRWKDYLRLQKLTVVLGTLAEDVAKERAGLQLRYEAAMAEVSFSTAMPNAQGGAVSTMPAETDAMSVSLARYSDRIAHLDQQIAMFDRIQQDVRHFMQDNEIDTTGLG